VADRVSASSPPLPSPPPGYVIPPRYWSWLGSSWTLAALVWAAAISCGVAFTYRSLHWFDNKPWQDPERRRADGNSGHAQIDFGGQWLMGRMLVTGHGRELYHRQRQWEVLRAGYPVGGEAPMQREQAPLPVALQKGTRPGEDWRHDAANLMNWFMGDKGDPRREWKKLGGAAAAPLGAGNPLAVVALEAHAAEVVSPEVVAKANEPSIGGPLYPPVHALFYAPLGLIDRPQVAYHAFQVFCALLVPVAGLGVKVLTRGRIWWSVATLGLFTYPGLRGGIDLGQNPVLSLTIAIWGWALASRGRNAAGGMVWGLLAFKPTWAMAIFLVPLLMRRWRFCLAMVVTGAALGLATLPFVGLHSWFDWLRVGREANELYKVNNNWIHLSRDLQGLPRRVLLDFDNPHEDERRSDLIDALAMGLWGAVLGATAIVYLLRGDRSRPTGVGAGFLFLGAYLTCLHFMYYDVLVSAAALAVLFADPKQFLRTRTFAVEPVAEEPAVPAGRALTPPAAPPRPFGARMRGYVNSFAVTVVLAIYVQENSLSGMELEATVGIRDYATPAADGGTRAKVPRVKGDTGVNYPTDTFLLLALWGWCGVQLLRRRDEGERGA
jgi:hypothetical protein